MKIMDEISELIAARKAARITFTSDTIRCSVNVLPCDWPHYAMVEIGPQARFAGGNWELCPWVEFTKQPIAVSRIAALLHMHRLSNVPYAINQRLFDQAGDEKADVATLWVYFFKAVGAPFIKIGKSFDIDARRRLLQCGCPFELIELGRINSERFSEAALHRQFGDSRHRGEWFLETPELLQFIETQKKDCAT